MRAYVMTSGSIFGLIVVAHIWRVVVEPRMASDPWWYLITAAAAALCAWAFRLAWDARAGRA